ncbi:MAG: hypothetical protein IT377_12785 [Polyangiaceae bacterium]|nr:hypothetical protein [Polyangiaceae bacterium]
MARAAFAPRRFTDTELIIHCCISGMNDSMPLRRPGWMPGADHLRSDGKSNSMVER